MSEEKIINIDKAINHLNGGITRLSQKLFNFDIPSILEAVKNREKTRIVSGILRRFYRSRPPEGVKVVEENWDFLVVLDACRFDFFEDYYKEKEWLREGNLSQKTSRGSMSIEWLNRNFTDYYGDLVYVSANGFVSPYGDTHFGRKNFDSSEHFHHVYQLFMDDELQEGDVVPPEKVTEKAVEAAEEYPEKRIIIHYMQPHAPYLGNNYYEPEKSLEDLQEDVGDKNEIRNYYKANLDRVMTSVKDLLRELNGKFVITADHGELLGDYGGLYRHPHSVYLPKLVEVPWLEIQKGERREIKSEDKDLDIDF